MRFTLSGYTGTVILDLGDGNTADGPGPQIDYVYRTPGTYDVTVTDLSTPPGHGEITVIVPTGGEPWISAFAPQTGPMAGGTSVTVAGVNFTDASELMFGSLAAQSFTVDSDVQITAVSPASPTATSVRLKVTTPGGDHSPMTPMFAYTATTTQPVADAPPAGTITEVLDWTGDDPGRVQAAYDSEQAKPSPRSTLLDQLRSRGAQ